MPGYPVSEVAVGERLQQPSALTIALGQLVVVDKGMESFTLTAIPDVPKERTVLEQLTVLIEELIAQPVVKGCAAGFGKQIGKNPVVPVVSIGCMEQWK